MRCEICGNFGTRNGEYCSCAYGSSLKIRNGDYQRDPKMERIMKLLIEKHGEVLRRLGRE